MRLRQDAVVEADPSTQQHAERRSKLVGSSLRQLELVPGLEMMYVDAKDHAPLAPAQLEQVP